MFVDLSDEATRVLVSEYVNKIVNFTSMTELNHNVHKLIHTFEVVKMARELITYTTPLPDDKTKQIILNAAVLHDIGRCHQFENSQYLMTANHGQMGAKILEKVLPDYKIEIETTRYHCDLPSDRDPPMAQPFLDYVRDADILGNLRYEIDHLDVFLKHYQSEHDDLFIDAEIFLAAKERRPAVRTAFKKCNILTALLSQLLWVFVLKTKAAAKLAAEQRLFIKYRNAVVNVCLPRLKGTISERESIKHLIETSFP
ncbi:MAG: HD domain-containing protein, partial [Alphaproteobacteria bacterium]